MRGRLPSQSKKPHLLYGHNEEPNNEHSKRNNQLKTVNFFRDKTEF